MQKLWVQKIVGDMVRYHNRSKKPGTRLWKTYLKIFVTLFVVW